MKKQVVTFEEDLFNVKLQATPTETSEVGLMWIDEKGLHLERLMLPLISDPRKN